MGKKKKERGRKRKQLKKEREEALKKRGLYVREPEATNSLNEKLAGGARHTKDYTHMIRYEIPTGRLAFEQVTHDSMLEHTLASLSHRFPQEVVQVIAKRVFAVDW